MTRMNNSLQHPFGRMERQGYVPPSFYQVSAASS